MYFQLTVYVKKKKRTNFVLHLLLHLTVCTELFFCSKSLFKHTLLKYVKCFSSFLKKIKTKQNPVLHYFLKRALHKFLRIILRDMWPIF